MPTAEYQIYAIEGNRLDPAFNPEDARELGVNLVPGSYVRGTVLGQVTTGGKFKAYAAGNSDGSQRARMILRYSCTVDADGNVVLGTNGEFPSANQVMDAFYRGCFRTEYLIGLDEAALTNLGGHLIQGSLTAGVMKF